MDRAKRLAENEILFRNVNERIKELQGTWGDGEVDFMCECADEACTMVIRLEPAEYERIRSNRSHFVVLPGHERADIEDVAEEHFGYLVVEKRPD
jgi:hypothetical protein